MKQDKIDASKLYADIKLENEMPISLVFYETDKNNNIFRSWETDLAMEYEVINGVACYSRHRLQQEQINTNKIANLQIPLYNISLYFFNHKMLEQEELCELEKQLVELYDTHHEHFAEYIEETFASTEFQHMKYFYSAYLIQELMRTFQMLDCLNEKEEAKNKRLVLSV